METFIHYSCPAIEDDDIAAVVQVLKSDWLTQGPAIPAFEQAISAYCGAPHAIALSSCTAGLHLACLALGIGPGDRVWTSPMSFVASANCARYAGAEVDFVDIEPETGNMCMHTLSEKLATAKRQNTLPKLVIPVHFSGRSCNMEMLASLKAQYGFCVVEDAAHSLGASYADGSRVGSHPASDAAVFSLHAVKPITTGEGGIIVTQRDDLVTTLQMLRSHGITKDAALLEHPSPEPWYYEQILLGYHYRLTDIQAALGLSQMGKLNRFITSRRAIAERYQQQFKDTPLTLPPADANSGWHLYVVHLASSHQRANIFRTLQAEKIGVNVHYIPIHTQPYYRALGFSRGDFPKAEQFYAQALSLPIHPRLSETDQMRVIHTLRQLI